MSTKSVYKISDRDSFPWSHFVNIVFEHNVDGNWVVSVYSTESKALFEKRFSSEAEGLKVFLDIIGLVRISVKGLETLGLKKINEN